MSEICANERINLVCVFKLVRLVLVCTATLTLICRLIQPIRSLILTSRNG